MTGPQWRLVTVKTNYFHMTWAWHCLCTGSMYRKLPPVLGWLMAAKLDLLPKNDPGFKSLLTSALETE